MRLLQRDEDKVTNGVLLLIWTEQNIVIKHLTVKY